jgi:branched-chain amino acid transport system substrate-binding protein
VAPAIPVAMQKGKMMIGLFALEVNSHFHYPKYFSMVPYGPDPKVASAEGFFAVAAEQNPKPQTVAIISEDSEFGHNGAESGEINAKKYGMKVVYNKTFPPGTTDFSPIVRAVAAANADIVMVVSYPLSSVGIVQSVNELGFKPKMIGGAMVGLQATVFKNRLKSKLNGFINYETWVPSPKLMPRAQAFFAKYQERAKTEGVDPLGYYLGGWGYADFQVLGAGVEGAKSLDDAKIADWLHHNEVHTIIADISFGPEGEWTKPQLFQVQYHGITEAANLETWRGMSYQTVVYPPDQKTGAAIYPYEKAK